MTVEIELLPDPERRGLASRGPIECVQSAIVTVDAGTFEQIWTASTLELLARSYWRYLERRSFGAIRVLYGESGERIVALCSSRLKLLRFRQPVFTIGDDTGAVEWPIERGLLVAADGRGRGYLRISVDHESDRGLLPNRRRLKVTSAVLNFYPWIRGSGRFARLGTWIYSQTQLRIHLWVTRGFLRSLEDLPDEVMRRGEDPEEPPVS